MIEGKAETIVTCEYTFDHDFETDDYVKLDKFLKDTYRYLFGKIGEKHEASHVTIKVQNFLHEKEKPKVLTYAEHFFNEHPDAPFTIAYYDGATVKIPLCKRWLAYGVPSIAFPDPR